MEGAHIPTVFSGAEMLDVGAILGLQHINYIKTHTL
jgi:hypothetical protein